ncbi:collagenase [Lentzea albida]|uniref:Collagenase n=1 Tax=Lentzea albida TaxID=65499 RepID=A0A1H9SLY9_9PSEU|nr:collagenase [Lentzea albida]SER85309.1 Collagenase [Lentzea albida]
MRTLALVVAMSAGLLVPVNADAHAAPADATAPAAAPAPADTAVPSANASPNSPLLPPAVARTIHHPTTDAAIQTAAVTDYPAELRALTRTLDTYTSADDEAVHASMLLLYYGHTQPEFLAAVRAEPEVLRALRRFVLSHLDFFGTDRQYLVQNATRELGRFLQHKDIAPRVRPLLVDLASRGDVVGRLAPLWVGVAEMVDWYDKANCRRYNTCDFRAKIDRRVLTVRHTCSATLRIRAQQLTAAQLRQTCASLAGQDAAFHRVVRDPGPVAGDNNTSLEVVVFNTSNDYRTYAGVLFDISTNNGGMYLEGDPALNQARFIAHEADWLPTFAIWNLNHEYTHYLDGRFDMHGDFEENMTTPTVWWIEGFAEHLSYSYRGEVYADALAEAKKRTYALSTLFDTTYDHDTKRVYNWGYLAVRYLLEKHPEDIAAVLADYRAGDWAGARDHLTRVIGSRYDADWYGWLAAVR